MVQLTNLKLVMNKNRTTTTGGMLNMFGVMILITWYEFTYRVSLWSTTVLYKYMADPYFGKTGMPKNVSMTWCVILFRVNNQRYGLMIRAMRNKGGYSSTDLWTRSMNIYLSTLPLYISYEKGGHWINHGLPMKVAINRKPENGCEIQNTCCGRNMIMMRLKLLKTAEE